MSCAVQGCADAPTTVTDLASLRGGGGLARQVATCTFHAQALGAGAAFIQREGGEIILGAQVPPRILNYTLQEDGVTYPTLTLELGRDGIVEQTVAMQVSPEFWERLFVHDEAELGKEVERNRRTG